jgi:hypothetical protein
MKRKQEWITPDQMIELIIVASLAPFFLLGVATMLQGGLLAGLGGACLASMTLFFGYRFLKDEIHRRFQISKSTN